MNQAGTGERGRETDPVADPNCRLRAEPGRGSRALPYIHRHEEVRAQRLDHAHDAVEPAPAGRSHGGIEVFGPDAEHHLGVRAYGLTVAKAECALHRADRHRPNAPAVGVDDRDDTCGDQVHGRAADERGDELVRRPG